MDSGTFYILQIERGELLKKKSDHIEEVIRIFKTLAKTQVGEHSAFLFHGYDDDPREVWDIPECQKFCLRVMKEIPEYFEVADTLTKSVLLHCTAVKAPDGVWRANPGWASVLPEWAHMTMASKRG